MGEYQGKLYFAPGIPMDEVPLDEPKAMLEAMACRIDGFFIRPIWKLAELPGAETGALFAAALLVAALIESVAKLDGETSRSDRPIAEWLEARVDGFDQEVLVQGNAITVGAVFETRFRHSLAHQGYVASRGRLSREVDGVYSVVGDIVTLNPFALLTAVQSAIEAWLQGLRNGSRDIRAFHHRARTQFAEDVDAVRRGG